jgi:MoxR-like ATPase
VLSERDYVNPDDIKRVAGPVLVHRLVLTPESTINDIDPEAIIDDILTDVSPPTLAT